MRQAYYNKNKIKYMRLLFKLQKKNPNNLRNLQNLKKTYKKLKSKFTNKYKN